MAEKYFEAGTRFDPDKYVIVLIKMDEDDIANTILAIGVEVKTEDDVVKLQSSTLSMSDFTPVPYFDIDN